MTDTNGVAVNTDVKSLLATKEEEYKKVVSQIQQLEQQVQATVQQFQKTKDGLLTQGIELQGAIKTLRSLLPAETVAAEVVEAVQP